MPMSETSPDTHDCGVIGAQAAGHLRSDLGEHRPRTVLETRYARSLANVEEIVRAAARQGTPIYPLSTGKNWGMGSRFPVVDGCTVLDLSQMNRIRTLDLDHGYAVIEPGVTQRQLVEQLEGTPWMLNVATGCADAGVVGNALERGDGTIRARREDLLGVEVVLGTGETMTTGGLDRHGRYHGLIAGPDLTQAFVQSNLGVVTAMAIGFVPRPETVRLINATFDSTAFAEAMDAVIKVGRVTLPTKGLLRLKDFFLVPSAGSPAVPPTADPSLLSVQVPLLGSRDAVDLSERLLRGTFAAVDGLVSFRSLDAATTPEDDPLYPRTLFARGIPSCLSLQRGLRINSCSQVDDADIGWLMFLPLVPLDRASMTTAVELFGEEVERHATAAMLEFNVISPQFTNLVTQMPFVREPGAVGRVHALRDAIRTSFANAGFFPYRSNIDHQPVEILDRSAEHPPGPLGGLKKLCDPNGIIAPGRYLTAQHAEI